MYIRENQPWNIELNTGRSLISKHINVERLHGEFIWLKTKDLFILSETSYAGK